MTRIPALQVLGTDELIARRCELADQISPLWMRLDALDDELMARHRETRRARILAPPPLEDVDHDHDLHMGPA